MTKEIPLHDALHFLRSCSVIVLEGRYIEPHIYEIEDDYTNEFMSLQWEEVYRGEEVNIIVSFNEGDNTIVLLDGCDMTLVNSDGEEEVITLLREWSPLVSDSL